MRDQRHRQLAERAEENQGVFTRRDALEIGLSDSALFNGVDKGRYRKIWPGVYAIAGSPDSLRQRMIAAVRSMPDLAAISHRTAAEIWGLSSRGIRAIDVVTTRWDRVKRPAVSIHESLDLTQADVTQFDELPVTTAARTVVDLGAVDRWAVERALETGIRNGLFTYAEVEALMRRVARKGRRGVGVIRPLLEARRRWDTVTESALEDRFLRTLCDLGLPQPRSQYVVRDEGDNFVCRADFAYPEHRLLIELDSEAHHLDRITFRRDRSKQNSAMVLGWTVLRYTWWDLEDEPYRVAANIRSALGSAPPT